MSIDSRSLIADDSVAMITHAEDLVELIFEDAAFAKEVGEYQTDPHRFNVVRGLNRGVRGTATGGNCPFSLEDSFCS